MSATLTDTQLLADIAAVIKSNGVRSITGPVLQEVLNKLVNNKASLITHASSLGLRELDPTRAYIAGETYLYRGAIWETITGHPAGINPDVEDAQYQWNQYTTLPTAVNFDEWDNGTSYDDGDTVRRGLRLFESLVDSNQGNDPSDETYPGSTLWVEVSASENKWGEDYFTDTYYTKRQVVFQNNNFYWLKIDSGEVFRSNDFDTELADGKWQLLGGGAAQAYVGYNKRTGATYTPVLADANTVIDRSHTGANTITIPTNASVAYPIGTLLTVGWDADSDGQPEILGSVGVIFKVVSTTTSTIKIELKGGLIDLVKIGTNTWRVGGNIEL